MEWTKTREQLKQSGNSLILNLQNALQAKGKKTSGELFSSLKARYELGETVGMELSGSTHWKFIDKGVDGTVTKYGSPYKRSDKMPPLTAVRNWMDIKGIGMGEDEAWLTFWMQRRWHETGIKPTFIFTNEIKKFMKSEVPRITAAIKQDTLKELARGNTNGNE